MQPTGVPGKRGAVTMRKGYTWVFVWLTAILAGCSPTSVEDDSLAFTLPDLDGHSVSLSDDRFAGKVVLVELWGTWCPPCIGQIPHLIRWQEDYGDRGFEIVAIEFASFISGSPEAYRAGLKGFAEEQGINYTVLQGGETADVSEVLPNLRNLRGFPTSIFVGRDGRVRHIKSGFGESEVPYYKRTIQSMLLEGDPVEAN